MSASLWPPGLHYLPEFAQIHVHWVMPSHPLPSSSLFAFNLSQHQSLFQWVGSSYQVAKVLELQLQHQSFQWIFRTDFPLGLIGLISLLSKRLSSLLQHHSSKASNSCFHAFLALPINNCLIFHSLLTFLSFSLLIYEITVIMPPNS